jgi:N-acetylmuramoyl-L-alanine amidase
VRDVQQRLLGLGYTLDHDDPATYGAGTDGAVRAFQAARGLRIDGICGQQTWSALVQAGYALGDRLLFLRQPMLRGDDVATLQRQLGALGFDPGKVDGAFGPETGLALQDFQRNAGLTVDGICGPGTIVALGRLGPRCDSTLSVSAVRELERWREQPRTLAGLRIVFGDGGGAATLAGAAARVVAAAGAISFVTQHPDQAEQAAEANLAGADTYVGLVLLGEEAGCRTAYYAGHRYESPGGRRLAEITQNLVSPTMGAAPRRAAPDGERAVRGMALPILVATKMPAIVCELGPAAVVTERLADVASALGRALRQWAAEPLNEHNPQPHPQPVDPGEGESSHLVV